MITLRTATEADARFLYEVQRDAMQPVSVVKHPDGLDDNTAYAEYLTKFIPEEIQVIQFKDKDVGRLRLVRSPEEIYVGGIQILPQYQRKGIGTEIFRMLIAESNLQGTPITLEVHEVNALARSFYEKLGFLEKKRESEKIHLVYTPK